MTNKETKRKMFLQFFPFLAAIPTGWLALWLTILIGGPHVKRGPAAWAGSVYVRSLLRMASHALDSGGFWPFIFSAPTIQFFSCALPFFFLAGGVVGFVTRELESEPIGFGIAAATFAVPAFEFWQNLGPVRGAAGEIGHSALLYSIGCWIVLCVIAEKTGSWGAESGALFWKKLTEVRSAGGEKKSFFASTQSPSGTNDPEARFQQLENLLEDRLITEEEYQRKRKEILRDI